jgi:outer membrane beta-barrel protein
MKRILFLLSVLVLLCASVSPGFAGVQEGSISVSPYVGGYVFDGAYELNHAPVFGLRIGYALDKHIGIEALGEYVDTEVDAPKTKRNNATASSTGARLEGLYHFMPDGKFVPFVAVGVGGINIDAWKVSETNFAAAYGVGLKYFITDSLALRADARHIAVFGSLHSNLSYTAGITYAFGGKKAAAAPKAAPVKVDSDGDGVADDKDKCPNTPKAAKVDSNGCPLDSDKDGVADYLDKCSDTPAGVKVDAAGCPLDSDKDGVMDSADKCPGTPAGAKVDAAGCPLDSDGDGVADYIDKCPNTPKGAKVDTLGCPPTDTDKDGVTDDLDKCPATPAGVKVDVTGCPLDADKDGVADYLDKCPDTPGGVKVDKDGCTLDADKDGVAENLDKCPATPAGVKVDVTGCPLDADKDGVADYLDKCPATPAVAKVDKDGCPLDADKDGIADYLDKCPNSPAGAKVDKNGCVESVVINVVFDSGKSEVKAEFMPELEKFALYMKDNAAVEFEIQGHTDNVGNDKANMKLSDQRAKSVMNVLVTKYGIAQSRLTAKGYGQTKPVDTNKTPAGKAKNRRVEAVKTK